MSIVTPFRRAQWEVAARVGSPVGWSRFERLTVLMAVTHPTRAARIGSHVRNILRCDCVDRLVISNHNPDLALTALHRFEDPRVRIVSHSEPRGCGHRWRVAHDIAADFLLVIDDDVLLWPSQVQALFSCLLANPAVPHGISGLRYLGPADFQFDERRTGVVDLLCEVYAVTKAQVDQYEKVAAPLAAAGFADQLESAYDFAVVSGTGSSRPLIHDLGRILRCASFRDDRIAVHRRRGFWTGLDALIRSSPALMRP